MRQTTVGWKLLVQWNDGLRQWVALKILKESNPVQVAEYAVARGIGDEPAFAWWTPYMLRKHDVIVLAVNSRLQKLVTNMVLNCQDQLKKRLRSTRRMGIRFGPTP